MILFFIIIITEKEGCVYAKSHIDSGFFCNVFVEVFIGNDCIQEPMEYMDVDEEEGFCEGIDDYFEHYLNGEKIEDNCPDDLLIYACF